MRIEEINPKTLKEIDNKELLNLHFRIHQLAGAFKDKKEKRQNLSWEDLVNAHVFIVEEMQRRGLEHDKVAEIDEDSERLISKSNILSLLSNLQKEVVLVPNIVCLVGSSVRDLDNAGDIDILVRANKEDKYYLIQSDNFYLPLRNAFRDLEKEIHIIDNPQGAHGDHIPLYDLVLRRKSSFGVEVVKSNEVKIDLGCGSNKPDGYIGIDMYEYPGVDIIADLEKGIPLPSNYADEIRAWHFLEHISDRDFIMSEIWRVLKPGGKLVFEVPSTKSEGAFVPGHKSFWNKTVFYFYSQDNLLDGRPKFIIESLEEVNNREYIYVRGVLKKPEVIEVEKAETIKPIAEFDPPKPQMKIYFAQTEAFTPEEIKSWFDLHKPVMVEVKYNGFRTLVQKSKDKVSIFFEDSKQERNIKEAKELLSKIDHDFILDCDVGLEKNGKREPRLEIMKLTGKEIKLDDDEKIIFTVFDVVYWDKDIHSQPFKERRKILEDIYENYLKDLNNEHIRFDISQGAVCDTFEEVKRAWEKFGSVYMSEGIVLKDINSPYELKGSTKYWAKVKHALEIKAIVLDVKRNKNGTYSYLGGIKDSNGDYVELGYSFNSKLKAKKGDIMTFQVQEIIVNEDGDISWLGATPIDIDKDRSEPYTVKQVLDLANRAKVLQDVSKGIPYVLKPFSHPLSGASYIPKIMPLIPEHKIYVEPYCGSATLFWAKEPAELEVLNDIHPLYYKFLKSLQSLTDKDIEWLKKRDWSPNRDRFERLANSLDKTGISREFVYAFKYVNYYSRGGAMTSFVEENKKDPCSVFLNNLEYFRDRLKKVKIYNKDGVEIIKEYDLDGAFMYIDPPWNIAKSVQRRTGIDEFKFDEDKLNELIRTLEDIKKADVMLVYDRNDLIKWNKTTFKYPKKVQGIGSGQEYTYRNFYVYTNYHVEKSNTEEGETRAERAINFWTKNWYKIYPKSGKGRFVYQLHFRGLTEEEINLPLEELLYREKSVHGDLRLETEDGLYGFTVFEGDGREILNTKHKSLLIDLPEDRKLQCTFKVLQPKAWLEVGVNKPFIVRPGGPGATSKKYAKFFAMDYGTYHIGVWREHMYEFFFNGKLLNGRLLITYAPIDDERIWLIDRPKDQTPYANKHDLEDVIKELKAKKQKYLIWCDEKSKPQLIDVENYEIAGKSEVEYEELCFSFDTTTINDEERFVLAPFVVPNKPDRHGDIVVNPEKIERALHRYMLESQKVMYNHSIPISNVYVVEAFVSRGETRIGDKVYPPGTGFVGFKILDDNLWNLIKSGIIKGVSYRAIVSRKRN